MSVTGWGGKRAHAGRRINPLRTSDIAQKLIERAKKERGSEFAPTPLEYMLCQLWDKENSAETRFAAARECLPYCHPKLSSVTVEDLSTPKLIIEFIDFSGQVVSPAALGASPVTPAITAAVVETIDDEAD